jgi:hypothetical protein
MSCVVNAAVAGDDDTVVGIAYIVKHQAAPAASPRDRVWPPSKTPTRHSGRHPFVAAA